MKLLTATITLTLLFALGPLVEAADLQSELMANEKTLWATKDADVVRKLVTDDTVEIRTSGVLIGRDVVAKDLAADPCKVTKIDFQNPSMRKLAEDVAVVMYTAVYEEDCGGKKKSAKLAASGIWQKQNGKWLEALYQSTPIP
jgi:uncharacterized protein (TIGR02246 family)